MLSIGDEMESTMHALRLGEMEPQILDLCMAPGGYTSTALKYNPSGHVSAITLPTNLGGHEVIVSHSGSVPQDERVDICYIDMTMLANEFGAAELLKSCPEHIDPNTFIKMSPYEGKVFSLIFCDGQVLRNHAEHRQEYRESHEASRLTLSQLIFAMSHIEAGGTFIMLLHKPEAWNTLQLLNSLNQFSHLELFKPTKGHRTRSSFYAICKNVQPDCLEARKARAAWQDKWQYLTFSPPHEPISFQTRADNNSSFGNPSRRPVVTKDADDVLAAWGQDFIKLAEPIWNIQLEALGKASWMRKKSE